MSVSSSALPGEAAGSVASPYVQFLGTKAGTEYVEYAPGEGEQVFGYAALYVPPNTVIDFAQDARDKMRHWGVSEEGIDNILFTHSHFDHFDAPTVLSFARDRWEQFQRETHAYASETVFGALQEAAEGAEFLTLTQVSVGDRIALAEGLAATVLPSSHWTAPTPVQFLLEFHGKTLLYAVDAAAMKEEGFAALEGHCVDGVITDCTYLDGEVDPALSGHMNYSMVSDFMAELRERGLAQAAAPCYITHLIPLDYAEAEPVARGWGLRMAYDGLRISVAR